MSNENLPPSAVPPQIVIRPGLVPLGESAEDRLPVNSPVSAVEAILRQPRRIMYQLRQSNPGTVIGSMLLVGLICALVYGVVIGSFSMGTQLWAAPAKVALGLLISVIICLPSLYIFTCLSGSRATLAEVFGLVCGLLLLMTILLVGFAPVAWLFSQSTSSVVWMGVLHLLFWFIATLFGLRFLQNGFAHSHARSNAGLNTWIIIFMLVVLQMSTALRPLIGTSRDFLPREKKFFLAHWADNIDSASRTNQPTAQRD